MKIAFSLGTVLIVISSFAASACKCRQPPLLTSISDADTIFRAVVLRELKEEDNTKKYIVNVRRVFEGCTFKASERIVVTTSTSSCGVPLDIDTTYVLAGENVVLDAATKAQLNATKISRAVTVNACDYTRVWDDVSSDDRNLLREYDNTCPKPCNANVDCPNKTTCKNSKCSA